MEKEGIKKLFDEFVKNYDVDYHGSIWNRQSGEFRRFWENKIINENYVLTAELDLDPIIRILDYLARGSRLFRESGGEAVAKPWVYQGAWYRLFNSLKERKKIRKILDDIFKNRSKNEIIGLIDKLKEANQGIGNGLTGEKAVILNDLLFAYNPNQYVCVVSLEHRLRIINIFGIGDSDNYKSCTYGEKIIKTNEDIILGFKNRYDIDTTTRALTQFLYSDGVESLWNPKDKIESYSEEIDDIIIDEEKDFSIEKHLEDFLIANWEKTELGKKFNLIQEEGIPVSQQYTTSIGRIDILVKDKSNNYVVIELKKGKTGEKVVGQILKYMGWIKKHKAKKNQKIKGIIISGEDDEKLKYSLEATNNIELFVYKIDFSLKKII